MKKILRLQSALLRKINEVDDPAMERDLFLDWDRVHMASSARIAYQLAEARNVDPILAACACSVHDYGRIVTGKQAGHAEAGYMPVQEFLQETGLFSEWEIQEIAISVKNHSRKAEVGTPLEEIVKDADVLDFYQYGFTFARQEQKDRLEQLIGKSVNTPVNASKKP